MAMPGSCACNPITRKQPAILTEVTPDDALIIAGEYVNDRIFAYTATWYGTPKAS